MKTKRAAAFLLCVCLILCLLPSLSASRAFDGVAFLVVNNTLLRPLTTETMPVFIGKEVFVPYSVLDRLSSVKYKYEPQKEKLTIYNEEGFLVFDLAGGRTYDETGAEYEFDAAYVERAVKAGADAITFGDDYGTERALLMSPASWRAFFKPRLKELFAPAVKAGLDIHFHSCGQISDILEDTSLFETV